LFRPLVQFAQHRKSIVISSGKPEIPIKQQGSSSINSKIGSIAAAGITAIWHIGRHLFPFDGGCSCSPNVLVYIFLFQFDALSWEKQFVQTTRASCATPTVDGARNSS
jgi:hypothetical protein